MNDKNVKTAKINCANFCHISHIASGGSGQILIKDLWLDKEH